MGIQHDHISSARIWGHVGSIGICVGAILIVSVGVTIDISVTIYTIYLKLSMCPPNIL